MSEGSSGTRFCVCCGGKVSNRIQECPHCDAHAPFAPLGLEPNNTPSSTSQRQGVRFCVSCGEKVSNQILNCPHCKARAPHPVLQTIGGGAAADLTDITPVAQDEDRRVPDSEDSASPSSTYQRILARRAAERRRRRVGLLSLGIVTAAAVAWLARGEQTAILSLIQPQDLRQLDKD